MGDALLEGLAGLAIVGFRKLRELLARIIIGRQRPAISLLRERGKQLRRIHAAILRAGGHGAREIFLVVLRLHPLALLERAFDRHLVDEDVDDGFLLLLGHRGLNFDAQRVLRRLPLVAGLEHVRFFVVIRELLVQEFLAVDLEDDAGLAGVRVIATVDFHVELHAIAARELVPERGGNVRRFAEHEPAFAPLEARVLSFERKTLDDELGGLARRRGHRFGHDGLRRRDILLHEHGRHGERVADVVEAEARVVRREFMIGVVVDAEQVVHRVAVLHAVQPPHRHAARIRIARIDVEHAVLDPAFELRLLRGGEPGLAFGGHQARAGVVQHAQPQVRLQDLLVGLQRIERDLALVIPVAMALIAVLLEDGRDHGTVFGDCRIGGRAAGAGRQQSECGGRPQD